jgi:predicted lipoprotein with Yx(FWY)xxD motif
MKRTMILALVAMVSQLRAVSAVGAEDASQSIAKEDYVRVAMPPGFQVIVTELEGPVFADAQGHTLYRWPRESLRNGYVGDEEGKSVCTSTVTTTSAGLMSPYPPNLVLPNLDTRPSCAAQWPPVAAAADAAPIGKWTVITRADGAKQWAYDKQALYISVLDKHPGDVLGGTTRHESRAPAQRQPVSPPPNIPPGFKVATTAAGRLIVSEKGNSVYASEKDTAGRSSCTADCTLTWDPVLAPGLAQPQGEWTLLERAPGVRQWAFRKHPLYTYTREVGLYSQQGSDIPGWFNVYTQKTPQPPAPFKFADTQAGVVIADAQGKTVYSYSCSDDSLDQLSCDYPGSPSAYRLAICGGGQIDRCLKRWPYVIAAATAKSNNRLWTVIEIDPRTGNYAKDGQDGALRVWAYRGRPVYTYASDEPGEIKGNAVGEWAGSRNGFIALWVRDDFYRNDT